MINYSLRPYQSEAIEAVYNHLRTRDDNPCIVLPTGVGKSIVLGKIASDAVTLWNGRVLVLAHAKELLEQNAEKIKALCPKAKVGIYSAGLKSRDTNEQIIVAGIQSVHKRACELGPFDLIIIDEAHLIPPDGDGMYREFLNDAKVVNPNVRLIGLTATPFRLKGGLICKPENLLNHICYEAGLKEMIVQGYLSPLIPKSGNGSSSVDFDSLHIRAGEFVSDEVEVLMNNERLVENACYEIVQLTKDRNAVLIFGCSVDHCKKIKKSIEQYSHEECALVTAETPSGERELILDRIKGKEIQSDLFGNKYPRLKYLVNVSVLTTGFDAPNIDCIAILRPTASAGLLLQMVGRGLRLSPATGKQNCLARGTLILTNQGEVPIEQVTKDMLLWDGQEFVKHEGTICNGRRNVICFNGLVATPEHKVWTKCGWRTFEDCSRFNIPISVTGIDGKAIRETDNYFKYCFCDMPQKQGQRTMDKETQICIDKMRMRRSGMEKHRQCEKMHCWLSCLRQATYYSKMVICKMSSRIRQMCEFSKQGLSSLRRMWNNIWFSIPHGNGFVYFPSFQYNQQENGYRQDRQSPSLLCGKHSFDNKKHKFNEYTSSKQSEDAYFQRKTSRNKICRRNTSRVLFKRNERGGNSGEVLQTVMQTEREVWDILNSGPRHRFTANGLLVSNCLVLDYGENIMRHGPLDAIRIEDKEHKTKKDGEKPAKKCPQCNALIETARTICQYCGYVFPPNELKHDATASEDGLLTGQVIVHDETVSRVDYIKWVKKGANQTKPPTLCIEYELGFNKYFREWICPEHTGYARQKFEKWWEEHKVVPFDPVPDTVDEAIEMANNGILKYPVKITIRHISGEKFDRISEYEYGDPPETQYASQYSKEDVEALLGVANEDVGCNTPLPNQAPQLEYSGLDDDGDLPF